jgi:hypothetical protein
MIFIHPYDKTTSFLSAIYNAFKNEDVTVINIGPSRESHDQCLKLIKESPPELTIVFLGHGGTDYLLGAAGDFSRAFGVDEEAFDDPRMTYHHGHFIDESNVGVFLDKKVFCVSCHSGVELGSLAIDKGARVFLGFGDIPTDQGEFEKIHLAIDQSNVDLFGEALISIITDSLSFASENKSSFSETVSLIRLFTNLKCRELILQSPNDEMRRIIADAFFYFKRGIRVFGANNLRLIEQ